MSKHIGIVGCSAEGAALCYRTICKEGTSLLGRHAHPEITMHTFPLSEYMRYIEKGDWEGVADLMPVSYTHLRAHETRHDLVCRLLLEKKKTNKQKKQTKV